MTDPSSNAASSSNAGESSIQSSRNLARQEHLRLYEQYTLIDHNITSRIERKAALLATLCIAITAYLFTFDFGENGAAQAVEKILWLIAVLLNIYAARMSIKSLYIREVDYPRIENEYMNDESEKAFEKMADKLIQEYKRSFDRNEEQAQSKRKDLDSALIYAILGILSACIWLVLAKLKLFPQLISLFSNC